MISVIEIGDCNGWLKPVTDSFLFNAAFFVSLPVQSTKYI